MHRIILFKRNLFVNHHLLIYCLYKSKFCPELLLKTRFISVGVCSVLLHFITLLIHVVV